MKPATLILRDAPLHAQALSLGRPAHKAAEKSPALRQRPACAADAVSLAEGSAKAISHASEPAVLDAASVAAAPELALAAELTKRHEHLLEQERRAAHDKGYQEGIAQAQREAQQQIEKLATTMAQDQVSRAAADAQKAAQDHSRQLNDKLHQQSKLLEKILTELPAERERCLRNAEEDMLALAFEVVCRILGDQAATQDGLRALLDRSLKSWHGRSPLSIHLHPEDVLLLRTDADSLQLLSAAGFSAERASLRWVADAKVASGGVLLRSAEGALDARLEVQLDALKASLLQTREARRSLVPVPRQGEKA
ncbi:FliH/SctL family protein [Acidovorax sp. SUPP2539]|uniref:FliH/SctL family protein n=1 Tax=Acidovorax sp. SUPP2539 TaxID=2920878 RepID=UPI0023DE22B8|nr:FliH/SctL family protein [Acidovorax sp. SUPP2539]GKS88074.1 hypothetical protein AVTE2539_01935 [Acidovorax sp. SUPP2539]